MKNSPHPAFELLRTQAIDSLNLTVEEYQHKKTGAMHYHLNADNPENVFIVAFRTVPTDHSGVAHVLEHTALCGSEKYPVRDPFFMMIRRSLNTFMNAFTSNDWTAYPFATQNRKDFNNLLEVYLDATFFTRLDPMDFAQEGHRVEFSDPKDPESDLEFKGVVFNEMKGAMSSPTSALWHTMCEHLFPKSTYHYNSGGEPECIPDLTYDQLKAFYKKHYHPSNAVFMTFGDIPASEHQASFEKNALSKFEKSDDKITVSLESRFEKPITVERSYALDDENSENKTHLVMAWLLGKSTNLEESLKAHLLSDVLLSNSASPLRKALETTELGSAPSPLCGVEDSFQEMSFMCGLEGSKPENAEALEKLVINVLEDIAENGIAQEQLEAVLHQLELGQREISGDGYPFGLHLILTALSSAIHRGDPIALLNLDPVLEKLRTEIKDPNFIKELVRKNLLDNGHRVRLTLKPDSELNAKRQQAEKDKLEKIKQSLSEEEKNQIIEQSAKLAERQEQKEDEEVLPKVGLEDIPPELKIPSGDKFTINDVPTMFYQQGTNGLVYQQIIMDLPHIEDDLLDALPFYSSFLTELGCDGKDYLATQQWQDAVTGGVHAYSSIFGNISDVQKTKGHFIVSGKALARNHHHLTELVNKTLHTVRFDELDRIRELISQRRSRLEDSVTGNGHAYAMMVAASGMSPIAALSNRFGGLAGIKYLKDLDDSLKSGSALKTFVDKLQTIHQTILSAPKQFLLIGEQEKRSMIENDMNSIWELESTSQDFDKLTQSEVREQIKQAWSTSTQVNFCSKAYPTVAYDHPDAAALSVLGGFLRNGFLHRVIREQGGAYGGGATQDCNIAAFKFYSYRDPRSTETLDDFDRSIEWLLNEKHEWRQVEEAILGVISGIDKPGSPSGEAKKAFHSELHGRTADIRQAFRQSILKVQLEDLQRVGREYFDPSKASVAVISNVATLDNLKELDLEVHQL